MRQHRLHGTLLIVLLALLYGSAPTATPAGQDAEWVPMFNGRDLTGWDTFLSYQPDTGSEEILGEGLLGGKQTPKEGEKK